MELGDQYNGFLEDLLSMGRDEAWAGSHGFLPVETSNLATFQESPATLVLPALTATAAAQEANFCCPVVEMCVPFDRSGGESAIRCGGDVGLIGQVEQPRVKMEQEVVLQQCQISRSSSNAGAGNASGKKRRNVDGMPSKNLLAERRRRKRLNDRLSMLRSVVPKITKMDRTSILGDAVDYMKELLERIRQLQEEFDLVLQKPRTLSMFKRDVSPNEVLAQSVEKFEVERLEGDHTRVNICCAAHPGLLISTLSTLEALGLDVQQCVVSCFDDFVLHASCSEDKMQRELVSTEDIKQELLRNAANGGNFM